MTKLTHKIHFDLTSVDGNAFVLLGGFKRAARVQGADQREVDEVIKEATSGDYDHLVQTLMANIED